MLYSTRKQERAWNRQITKNQNHSNLYRNSYSKEHGRLSQGIPDAIKGINTLFFVNRGNVPAKRWKVVTY
jgi:hypothetical protein